MAVYVSETEYGDGPVLRMICSGEEVRLPLDVRTQTVTVQPTAPEWVARIARRKGYTVDQPDTPAESAAAPTQTQVSD